ncbi:uncharacterized protein LOC127735156 isoform X2 [Mytilus californianus]|uniref:uncharacterized protein LOC127735156 isoform X2 n=1 Tax=Mytilus californianus TaxID=6549 RepID=UPI002246812C|nr:uncharacterized protein LOC127735156 isoform X2 [Mytilus californianus]
MKEYRFHEGCLDHKWQSSYRRLWMVMKNNVIFIFRDRPFIPENHEGTLTIDPTTKFEVRPEKANNYKFILYTGNRRRINTFKSDKKSERDLWRGYIVGVARQKVPDDLDLPRDIINKIKQDVGNYHLLNGSDPPAQFDVVSQKSNTENSPRQSMNSGRSNPNRKSVLSDDSGVISHRSHSRSSGSGSLTIDGVGGGPVMRHKFSNHQDDTVTPSWFFEACTREKAESYLAIAAERKYGDTLMRESNRFKQDGSYVISKRIVKQGRSSIEHYEVIRVERGYKIKVENQHEAMRNLTNVMNYFVTTSGTYGTNPLTTNRLGDFGMVEDPYNTGRLQPADTVADILNEPPPDYEEPVQSRPQLISRQGHKTVTPSSAKFNYQQARHSYNTTRAASDYKVRAGKPSLDDIQTNIKAAAAIDMFDKTIDPFDEPARAEDYINLQDLQRQEDFPLFPAPPVPHTAVPLPPAPHQPIPTKSYVNEEPTIPPAPPPPRHERAKSVPNLAQQLQNAQLIPVLDKKAVTNAPPPSVKHVNSTPQFQPVNNFGDGVPTPQQLGLRKTDTTKPDPSKGAIMRSPEKSPVMHSISVPSPQQMGLKPARKSVSLDSEPEKTNDGPAIDVSHPGGVSSIKSRFEKIVNVTPQKQLTGVGSVTNQASQPTACPNTSDHSYLNTQSQPSNENPYDDAKTPVACGRQRSKSTPTISPEIREQLKVSRLAPEQSFMRHLNDMLGGQQQKKSTIPAIPGRIPQNFIEDDDDLYDKLPETDG